MVHHMYFTPSCSLLCCLPPSLPPSSSSSSSSVFPALPYRPPWSKWPTRHTLVSLQLSLLLSLCGVTRPMTCVSGWCTGPLLLAYTSPPPLPPLTPTTPNTNNVCPRCYFGHWTTACCDGACVFFLRLCLMSCWFSFAEVGNLTREEVRTRDFRVGMGKRRILKA